MRRSKIITAAIVLSCLLVVLVGGGILWRHFLPTPGPTSTLYEHYKGTPGIEASYLRSFHVNDSLKIDVTMLQALDTTAWHRLLLDFGFSWEAIRYYEENSDILASDMHNSFLVLCINADSTQERLSLDAPNGSIVIGSFADMCFSVYHTEDYNFKKTVFNKELKKIKKL